jgi:hypothetical protein
MEFAGMRTNNAGSAPATVCADVAVKQAAIAIPELFSLLNSRLWG